MSFSNYTIESTEDILTTLKTREGGLSTNEADFRLARDGRNEITAKPVPWYSILLRQMKSPFIYMLVGAAILAIALGEVSDGVIIIVFIVINTLVSFFQEYH